MQIVIVLSVAMPNVAAPFVELKLLFSVEITEEKRKLKDFIFGQSPNFLCFWDRIHNTSFSS